MIGRQTCEQWPNKQRRGEQRDLYQQDHGRRQAPHQSRTLMCDILPEILSDTQWAHEGAPSAR